MKDKLIEKLIKKEAARQKKDIDLIPSENFVSEDVLTALGSVFTNKYAEGYPHARYYGGNQVVDEVEELAKQRALDLFCLAPNKWAVNVQPYSGSPANLAVLLALVPPGETIMGLQLSMGGHLTHGHKVSATGKFWKSVQYDVDKETELLNYDAILELAKKEKPKLIVAGYTAYPRIVDWKKFRAIADAVGAYLLVDMSHLAGLIAGGAYPSPFPYADVVTTTTHKTLRGPRGAMVFSRKDKMVVDPSTSSGSMRSIADRIDKAVFPGLQGGPHVNQIAATAVALKEAKSPAFKKYASQVVKNAKALATELQKLGFRLVSDGTDSHLLLVDTMAGIKGSPSTGSGRPMGGKEASMRLEAAGIIANMNTIPHDPRSPFDPSGLRLGTPAVTTRGMKEKDMKVIAKKIAKALGK